MTVFDVIMVGTGFASSFFLSAYLESASPSARVLVLEKGRLNPHSWQVSNRVVSDIANTSTYVGRSDPAVKDWNFTIGFGGGSNCWWAVTPRMMPNDFRMQSAYGVGVDWPLSYEELEPFYDRVERMMAVSGPEDGTPFPRSGPYPQPPHRFSAADEMMKAAFPAGYFHQPTARARLATANRPACCTTGVCTICPVNAKFTVLNEMNGVYADSRVEVRTESAVQQVDTTGDIATGVVYVQNGRTATAEGDLIVLGANGIFNPHILLRSGFDHPLLGKRLHEQVALRVVLDLDGVTNYQGTSSITGHGYMLYDGPHRRERAACLIESANTPHASGLPALRNERGRWRERMILKFIFEDMPSEENYVAVNEADPTKPEVVHGPRSAYARRSIEALPGLLADLFAGLPIERMEIGDRLTRNEGHILGTTIMGNDPATSVIDRHLIHHQVRNLVVLGSSSYPMGSPTNPTLTLSALSLWSAQHLFG